VLIILAILVFPEPYPNFSSPTKSRPPFCQIKSAPLSLTERGPGRSARAFSSTPLRSRQHASASRSAAAFQIRCLAWWIRAADVRAISARISLRAQLLNSSEVDSSHASSASLRRDLSWRRSLGTGVCFGNMAANVIPGIAFRKNNLGLFLDARFGLPGVSSRLKASPSCSKLMTAEETEMPRSRSTAIQSERTRRRSPRALTSPASWIARRTATISRSVWSCRRPGAK
jgi:hypothetical protein